MPTPSRRLTQDNGEHRTMDWNPADEFLGPEPDECEACEGSGVVVFGITVYEPGCGYSHESSDERICEVCNGSGKAPERHPVYTLNRSTQLVIPDDDLPF